MKDGKLLSFDALQARRQGSRMNFWRYRQLHHFFEVHGHSIRDPSSLTPFERLFVEKEPIPHIISELYRLLGSAAHQSKPAYIRRWERDQGQELTDSQLTHLYHHIHLSSIDSKAQETNYKIISRLVLGTSEHGTYLPPWVGALLVRLWTQRHACTYMVGMSPNHTLLGKYQGPNKKHNGDRHSFLSDAPPPQCSPDPTQPVQKSLLEAAQSPYPGVDRRGKCSPGG